MPKLRDSLLFVSMLMEGRNASDLRPKRRSVLIYQFSRYHAGAIFKTTKSKWLLALVRLFQLNIVNKSSTIDYPTKSPPQKNTKTKL